MRRQVAAAGSFLAPAHCVDAFADQLASQLGQYNVTVNCIAPGVTMTEATKKIVPEEYIGMLPMMSAMKRPLEAEHLAGTAVFFASDDAELVTGQTLCVDGGTCMPA